MVDTDQYMAASHCTASDESYMLNRNCVERIQDLSLPSMSATKIQTQARRLARMASAKTTLAK